MNRRGFLGGLLATLAAPAVIRTPGLLMPVKPVRRLLLADTIYNNTWIQDAMFGSQLEDVINLLTASNEILRDMTFDAMCYGSALVRVESTVAGFAWRRINHSELLISG